MTAVLNQTASSPADSLARWTANLILLLCIWTASHGQTVHPDSCGLDSNPTLNKYEVAFLDSIIKDTAFHKNEFINKRVVFLSADKFVTKGEFFKTLKAVYRGPRGFYALTKKEKEEINYDAIIIINLKMYNPDDLVRKLKASKP